MVRSDRIAPITAKIQKIEPIKLGAMRNLRNGKYANVMRTWPISQGPTVVQRTAWARLNQGGAQEQSSFPMKYIIVESIRTATMDIAFIRSFEAPPNPNAR